MHICLDEKEENRLIDDDEEKTDDTEEDTYDELNDDDTHINLQQDAVHEKATQALDIKNSANWLQKSSSNQPTMQPVYNTDNPVPPSRV